MVVIFNKIKKKKMKGLIKTTGFKSITAMVVLVMVSVSTYAATTSNTDSTNSLGVVGGVALLIAAIVLPAFKGTKA